MKFGLKKTLRFALVFTMLNSSIGISQSNFWFRGGTNGSLGTSGNWAVDPTGTTNGTTPGVLDTAIFSVTSSNTVPLNRWSMGSANRSYGSVIISNSGTNYIMRTSDAGATNSSANNLTLMFGITNAAGAGVFQLSDTDRKATLKIGATNTDFFVANNSANTMTFQQQVGLSTAASNNRTLVVAGTGRGSVIFDGGLENGGTNGATLALRVNNAGAVQLGASTYTGGTILDSGTIALSSGSALGTGGLTINGGALGSVTSARTITNNINVGGNFGLGVTNAGFSGQTTTLNGNVDLGGQDRTVTMLANSATFGGAVSNGGLVIDSTSVTRNFNVSGDASSVNGVEIKGGVLALSNNGAISTSGRVNVSGSTTNATFDISGITGASSTVGSIVSSSNGVINLGAKELILGADTAPGAVYGVIQGTGGSLTKSGTGQLFLLAASNTYTGATKVNGGTLIVNGSLASSNTIVSAGATLGGSGFLQAVTLNGGTIAPGNSPGVLTMQNLDASNGNFLFELGAPTGRGTTYDAIDVAQNLVFGANTAFQFSVFGGYSFAENDTYNLFDWGNFDPGSFNTDVLKTALNTGINLSSSGLTWKVDDFLTNGSVSVALIPEPSTPALLGISLAALAGLRASRRRKI